MRRRRERDAAKERLWRQLVDRQRKGRLSVREFCRAEAIAESAFYFWRRELAKRDAEVPTKPAQRQRGTAPRVSRKLRRPEFLPVVLQSTCIENRAPGLPLRAEIEIQFPDATTLRVANGADANMLRVILAALRGEAC
jgi:hypothetical protein